MKKRNILINNDNIKALKKLPADSIHAVVTDPPYGMSDHPDTKAMLSAWLDGKKYKHNSKSGFMNKEWDSFVPQPELWGEVLRVMKPGGHCLAFFSTRTYDLGVLAMRLAGFEIRDSIQWLYGQGFPKSRNISKDIAKKPKGNLIKFASELRARRKELGLTVAQADKLITNGSTMYSFLEGRTVNGELSIYPPNKDYYKAIVKNFKLSGWDSIVENNIRYGDYKEGNFGYQKNSKRWKEQTREKIADCDDAKKWDGWGTSLKPACEIIVVARKPLEGRVADNVLKYRTGAINIDGCRIKYTADNPPIPQLAQGKTKVQSKKSMYDGQSFNKSNTEATIGGSLEGRWPANIIHDGSDDVISNFPTVKGSSGNGNAEVGKGSKNLPLNRGVAKLYCDSGSASRFFYCAKSNRKERNEGCVDNKHPTVKPLSLMKYLCKLVVPKNGIVLDPFMGSGSTGSAAMQEGFRFIGIELDKNYYEIACQRIKHWTPKKKKTLFPK